MNWLVPILPILPVKEEASTQKRILKPVQGTD